MYLGNIISGTLKLNNEASSALNQVERDSKRLIRATEETEQIMQRAYSVAVPSALATTTTSYKRLFDTIGRGTQDIRDMGDSHLTAQEIARRWESIYSLSDKIRESKNQTTLLNTALLKTDEVINIAKGSIDAFKNNFSKTAEIASKNINTIKQEFSILSEMINGLYSQGDIQRSFEYRISMLSSGDYDTSKLRGELTKSALKSYTSLEDLSSLTAGIMMSGATSGNIQRTIKLSETLSRAMVATGATAEESKRSILQLKQALSSGILQGDELRSIREQTPGVMMVLAAGIRKMAEAGEIESKWANASIGDIKKMGSEGLLTSETVVKAFEAGADSIDVLFENMPITVDRVTTTMKTMLQSVWTGLTDPDTILGKGLRKVLTWMKRVSTAFVDGSKQLDSFFEGFEDGISILSEVFEFISNIFITLADLLGINIDSMDSWKTAGEIAGTVITGIVLALIGHMATLAITTAAAFWPITLIAGALIGIHELLKAINGTTEEVTWTTDEYGNAVQRVEQKTWGLGDTADFVLGGIQGMLVAIESILYGIILVIGYIVIYIAKIAEAIGSVILTAVMAVSEAVYYIIYSVVEFVRWCQQAINALGGDVEVIGSFEKPDLLKNGENFYQDYNDQLWSTDSVDAWFEEIKKGWIDTTGNILGEDTLDIEDFQPNDNKALRKKKDTGTSYEDFFGSQQDQLDDIINGVNNIDSSTSKMSKEINLSDQDIEYLKSIAARDFMINVNTAAPVVTNTFGDIRETADVDAIIEQLTGAVEEELAVVLVG